MPKPRPPVVFWDKDESRWVVYDAATRKRLSDHETCHDAHQWILEQPETAS